MNEKLIELAMTQILHNIEPNPNPNGLLREGLRKTPQRVAKAMTEWFGGVGADIPKLLTTFEDGAENADEMVAVCNIPFYSKCEHHLADIIGVATVAYIPNGRIVGLSKLNRVVDAFARRPQVQERMTNDIANALMEHLRPLGVGVRIAARHMCMESRGVKQRGQFTITTAIRGAMKDEPETRAEFMALPLDTVNL